MLSCKFSLLINHPWKLQKLLQNFPRIWYTSIGLVLYCRWIHEKHMRRGIWWTLSTYQSDPCNTINYIETRRSCPSPFQYAIPVVHSTIPFQIPIFLLALTTSLKMCFFKDLQCSASVDLAYFQFVYGQEVNV